MIETAMAKLFSTILENPKFLKVHDDVFEFINSNVIKDKEELLDLLNSFTLEDEDTIFKIYQEMILKIDKIVANPILVNRDIEIKIKDGTLLFKENKDTDKEQNKEIVFSKENLKRITIEIYNFIHNGYDYCMEEDIDSYNYTVNNISYVKNVKKAFYRFLK